MAVPWRIHKKGIESLALVWGMYQLAWRDDEKITIEDIPELTIGMGRLTWLWAPEILTLAPISTTPLVILEAAVVVGAVASVAIAGEEGLETYVDYINPTNWKENVQDPKKVESLVQANRVVQAAMSFGVSEIAIAGGELLMNYKDEIFRSRWVTGPYLPF